MTTGTHPQTDYMSVAEVAAVLGLTRMTVYRMCRNGVLAHILTGPAGKTYRILRTSFEEHITPKAPASAHIPGQLPLIGCTGCDSETGAGDPV